MPAKPRITLPIRPGTGRAALLAGCVLLVEPGTARAGLAPGTPVPDAVCTTLDGRRLPLLDRSATTVLVFFRPGQAFSVKTLGDVAVLESEFAAKPVRFLLVVSGHFPPDDADAAVRGAGVRAPVVRDDGDALAGTFKVVQHPAVVVVDVRRQVSAFEGFRQFNFANTVRARIRIALGAPPAEVADLLNPPALATTTDTTRARRYVKMSEKLLGAGSAASAAEAARKAVALDGTLADGHAALAAALAAGNDCAGAAAAAATALELEADHALARSVTARCAPPKAPR